MIDMNDTCRPSPDTCRPSSDAYRPLLDTRHPLPDTSHPLPADVARALVPAVSRLVSTRCDTVTPSSGTAR
jgi:hypothetical protein